MEGKQSGGYHYVAMAGLATGSVGSQKMTARLPPRRGSITRKIFAQMAASILHALKTIGTILGEIIDYARAASCCKICSAGKATSTACPVDLLRSLRF